MPIPDQALSQLLAHNLGRIVCLEHSGSQEDHPSRRKLRVIDDLSQNGYGVVVVVILKELLTNVREADLSDFSLVFVGKMCVVVSRPMTIVTSEKGDLPKRVVDFLKERDTFRNKIM